MNAVSAARKLYETAPIGSVITFNVASLVAAGSQIGEDAYAKFSAEIDVLTTLVDQGLVEIMFRHHESSTGKRHIDLVKFRRLK